MKSSLQIDPALPHLTFIPVWLHVVMTVLVVTASGTAYAQIRFSDDAQRHADLATAQVLLSAGCLGKLGFLTKQQITSMSATETSRLQTCTDNASTDVAASVMASLNAKQISKERLMTQMIHESVLFAKQWSPAVSTIPTEQLIREARQSSAKLYPYMSK